MDRLVRLYSGEKVRITCDDDKLFETVYSVMIEPFLEDIEDGWLARGERAMPTENRVKGYLSYVGYMLIAQPDRHNVLSRNKIGYIRNRELTTDEIEKPHAPVKPLVGAAKKKWPMTAFEKYMSLVSRRPGNKLKWATVTTDGEFVFENTRYRVVDKRYAGRKVVGIDGLQYDYDRVWILRNADEDTISFFDQRLEEIPPEHIFVNEADSKEDYDGIDRAA